METGRMTPAEIARLARCTGNVRWIVRAFLQRVARDPTFKPRAKS
jgi:hypothetical protein